jgi:hypothetical protein
MPRLGEFGCILFGRDASYRQGNSSDKGMKNERTIDRKPGIFP